MNKVETIKADLQDGKQSAITDLHKKLKKLIADNNKSGYKVISVTPLTSGEFDMGDGSSGGFGFGYTSGLVVVFEKVGG